VNLPLARQAFTKLLETDRKSVLALNNLAVISFQINAADAGLRHYTQAIQLNPDNRLLLDNIAEALERYPNKRDGFYTRLNGLFQKADKSMQTAMAQKNLYRWGAGWTAKDQLTRFQNELHDIETEMNGLQRVYSNHVANVDRLQALMDDYNFHYAAAMKPWPFPLDPTEEDPNEWYREHYNQKIEDLTPTLEAANVAVDDDKIEAAKLIDRLTTVHGAQFPGTQHIMQPGQDVTPPAVIAVRAAPAPQP